MHQRNSEPQQRHQQQKAYNAVPPPPSLYPDSRRNPSTTLNANPASRSRLNSNISPNRNEDPNRNPNPGNGDLDRRSRRRSRARRPQEVATQGMDAVSSSGSNVEREISVIRGDELASSSDIQGSTSLLQSQSPNCMPSPNFNNEGCCTSHLSQVDASFGTLSDGLRRSVGICTTNRPSMGTPNKAKCKDIPTARPKWKDLNKTLPSANGDSKSDRMKYSPKVRSDMVFASDYAQDCYCTGVVGSRLLPDEVSTSSSYKDEHGFSSSMQEFKISGSPSSHCSTMKNRYIQKAKNEKAAMCQKNCFQPHWPSAKVEKALEEGEAFRCKIRVNAHMRTEAYVTIDGVPIDILIDGVQAQNRSIDGDVVAVIVNDVPMWTKLKGSVAKQNSADLSGGINDVAVCDNELPDTEAGRLSDEEQPYVAELSLETTSGSVEKSNISGEPLGTSEVSSKLKEEGLLSELADVSLASNSSKIYQDLVSHIASYPDKRPTGQVVTILEKSDRRQSVVGFLEINSKAGNKCRSEATKSASHNEASILFLVPSDNRFPKMVISIGALPSELKERYHSGDKTLGSELVAACIKEWKPDSSFPCADISHTLGQAGEIEAQLAAILFEHAVHSAEFPSPTLKCLPEVPWKIPSDEYEKRKDLTLCRILTIDPPTARDLDDALSIQKLENGLFRVGVHIADVSYFVHPETELDKEAQFRSTSVYLIQRVLPMLPRLLCDELCSLNPGVDRLAFSVLWDIDQSGHIVDQWIGRTIINSCCKLSYGHAQDIIDEKISVNSDGMLEDCRQSADFPDLYGNFGWKDIVDDIKALHNLAKHRRGARFEAGALRLQNSRLIFDLDEDGIPNGSSIYEHHDSNFLVEEFMLLANMTAAKVISGAFPDCALLRRHPEPNIRKMKELEDFCNKSGFELNASSSGALHDSLQKLCESHKEDSAMCSILMLYATKPMQLAKYFSTGECKSEEEFAHYALATPFYTHFTSPIRRYPDIVVHRTLLAALEAEDVLLGSSSKEGSTCGGDLSHSRCFTGTCLDKLKVESCEGRKALATAAMKHKVPGNQDLALLAEHCNRRKLASRNVRDASDKVYLWAMLKKKEGMFSEARVLAVGSKFVSLYVNEIAMERRVYFEDTEGLGIEWCSNTVTVILDVQPKSSRKERQGRGRALNEVAYFVNSGDSLNGAPHNRNRQLDVTNLDDESVPENQGCTDTDKIIEPAVLPLTLRLLTSVPVFVFATGGSSRPLDIGLRLYITSYLQEVIDSRNPIPSEKCLMTQK
ncbi:hypothetical protein GOP47_0004330 [Adiantum capillus-veneris]|uniref:DIS3-like exonuclease 2 n=1 Tax=Adiantum capillus-veneris TaxID=13818 RepID=A0A9D4V931_ADICA|nr:hypothetical protein GOP47_0004330 [Adiantum capillus-veneris]